MDNVQKSNQELCWGGGRSEAHVFLLLGGMETSLRARHLQTDDHDGLLLPFVAVRCLLALLMDAHLFADTNYLIP